MVIKTIKPEEIYNRSSIFIDVRSPREYQQGKIPGAINLPILDNDERRIVGLTYKKQGIDDAISAGHRIAQLKLDNYFLKVRKIIKNKQAIIYCWRGGLRSRAVAIFLKNKGLSVAQLKGGYRAYRRMVHSYLNIFTPKKPIFVLYGYTGSGKSDLLHYLETLDQPVLDLERLANHRGSVFGGFGLGEQPSQKDFEANLFIRLEELNDAPYIITEGESRKIGRCHLPNKIVEMMKNSFQVLVKSGFNERRKRVEKIYLNHISIEEALEKLEIIAPFLGKSKVLALQKNLANGEFRKVISYILRYYYDPLYYRSSIKEKSFSFSLNLNQNLICATNDLLHFINKTINCEQDVLGAVG